MNPYATPVKNLMGIMESTSNREMFTAVHNLIDTTHKGTHYKVNNQGWYRRSKNKVEFLHYSTPLLILEDVKGVVVATLHIPEGKISNSTSAIITKFCLPAYTHFSSALHRKEQPGIVYAVLSSPRLNKQLLSKGGNRVTYKLADYKVNDEYPVLVVVENPPIFTTTTINLKYVNAWVKEHIPEVPELRKNIQTLSAINKQFDFPDSYTDEVQVLRKYTQHPSQELLECLAHRLSISAVAKFIGYQAIKTTYYSNWASYSNKDTPIKVEQYTYPTKDKT